MASLRSKLIRLAHSNPDIRGDILPLLTAETKMAAPKRMLYLKHESGAVRDFRGPRAMALYKEIAAGPNGKPGPLIEKLLLAGFIDGFLGTDGEIHDWEDLTPEQFGTYF